MGSDEVYIFIGHSDGSVFSLQTNLKSTVRSFKEAIAHKCGLSPVQQCLLFCGRPLGQDHHTLQFCGLGDGCLVYLVPQPAPASRTNATGGTNGSTNSTKSPGANEGGGSRGSGLEQMNTPMQSEISYADTLRNVKQTFEDLAGVILDPISLAQELQDPDKLPKVQLVISNLRILNRIIVTNADLRGMPVITSCLRQAMKDREFLSMLTSRGVFQHYLAIVLACLSSLGEHQSKRKSSQAGRATNVQDTVNSSKRRKKARVEMSSDMSCGLGSSSFAIPNRYINGTPDQLYATKLWQLQVMGFLNIQENIRALFDSSGNVYAAVEWLMGSSSR